MVKQIFLFLLFTSACFSQVSNKKFSDVNVNANYKAIYSITAQPDSTNVKSKISGFLFTLLLGKNYSMYADNKKHLLDSIMRGVDRGDIKQGYILANLHLMPKPITNVKIIKNYYLKEITVLNSISSKLYAYNQKMSIINWEIKNETKTISDYKCQKAIGSFAGRNYIAWFTSEIPISDGPYKFNGLPGLIIKINDSRNHYEFLLKNFYKVENTQINLKTVDSPIYIKREEYSKLVDSYRTNPIPIMESEGAVFDKKKRKKMLDIFRKKKKSKNNRIELKHK